MSMHNTWWQVSHHGEAYAELHEYKPPYGTIGWILIQRAISDNKWYMAHACHISWELLQADNLDEAKAEALALWRFYEVR